jgi:hypothetical protein
MAAILDDEDDQGTAEAGPGEPFTDDDEALLRKLKRWERLAKQHWSRWREEARLCYDFVAGHQWSADDKAALLDQMRQPVTFNRVAPMVDAVTGAEILNRQEVRYSPREQGDVQVNEIITAADEWARELADTEDEESDCFADTVICGLGWTETRMDYAEDPEGRIIDDRVDPLEMWSDPQAKKRCLADSRYHIRARWRDKVDLPRKWRNLLTDETEGGPNHIDEVETGESGPRDDYERESAHGIPPADHDKRQVWVRHFQWFEKRPMYRMEDRETGEAITIDRARLKAISKMFMEVGLRPPDYVQVEVNKYFQAIVIGSVIVEYNEIEAGAFTFKCITGKRDRNAGTFYGVVRAMIDPQMWGNKFFIQIMHILNTAAKGGLLYEAGSFANPRKALEDWAKPDAAIELQRGALSGAKPGVQERQPTVFPAGLDKMMEFSLNNLPQTSGINLEMLGLVERDQPGVLEAHRKKAGYAILAVFFDSLRRYRKMKGRVRLFFIQNYISDGRLIKIKGKDSTERYVPLVKQKDTATYDVIVDDAPMSPNQKEQTWAMMQAMMPMLAKMGVPPEIWQVMLEYSPLPSSVSGKINQIISQKAQEPPPPDPDLLKVQAQAQSNQAEAAIDAQRAQQDAALAQQKAEQEAQTEREKMANDLAIAREKHGMEMEKTRQDLIATQMKHQVELDRQRHDMAMAVQNHQTNLMFQADQHAQTLAAERAMHEVKLTAIREQSAAKAKAIKTPKVKA